MIYNTYMFLLRFILLFAAIISEWRQFYVDNVISKWRSLNDVNDAQDDAKSRGLNIFIFQWSVHY